jgi:hypothetical protein
MDLKNKEEETEFHYSYKEFIDEGKMLCEKTNNIFKFCLNELLDINYIQGNLNISENIILELDILFSDVFMVHCLECIFKYIKMVFPIILIII